MIVWKSQWNTGGRWDMYRGGNMTSWRSTSNLGEAKGVAFGENDDTVHG